jgi:hypothetical protein
MVNKKALKETFKLLGLGTLSVIMISFVLGLTFLPLIYLKGIYKYLGFLLLFILILVEFYFSRKKELEK